MPSKILKYSYPCERCGVLCSEPFGLCEPCAAEDDERLALEAVRADVAEIERLAARLPWGAGPKAKPLTLTFAENAVVSIAAAGFRIGEACADGYYEFRHGSECFDEEVWPRVDTTLRLAVRRADREGWKR